MEPKNTMENAAKTQFDKQAKHYNETWAGWSETTLRALLRLADPQEMWRVLDVATGTGFTALAFAPRVAQVTGADISPEMLGEAEKRGRLAGVQNVNWVECAAEVLPFDNASFDLVTVRIAPHHFVDVPAFLREVKRVLVGGGVFVLADTTVPGEHSEAGLWQNRVERERDPSHQANLSPSQWQDLCETAGLFVTDLDAGGDEGIGLTLDAWLKTAGCNGEAEARVRALFAGAPASAEEAFRIKIDEAGETHFVWQRVLLRAVAPKVASH